MLHIGFTVSDDLAFKAIVAIGVIRNIIVHSEWLTRSHKIGQFKLFGIHWSARTPGCTVINPCSSLRIKGIICTFSHDFPCPLSLSVYFNGMGVIAKLTTVVARSKAMTTCTGFEFKHRFPGYRSKDMIGNVFIKTAQIILPFPKRLNPFHIASRSPFNKGKSQVQ